MPQNYRFIATVELDATAESEPDARRAAFELLTSAVQPTKRGRGAPTAARASVTGVRVASDTFDDLAVARSLSSSDVLE